MTNIWLTPPVHGRFLGPNSTCSRKPLRLVLVLPFLAFALGSVGMEYETASMETFESAGNVFIYQIGRSRNLTICKNQTSKQGNCWWKPVTILTRWNIWFLSMANIWSSSFTVDLFHLDTMVWFWSIDSTEDRSTAAVVAVGVTKKWSPVTLILWVHKIGSARQCEWGIRVGLHDVAFMTRDYQSW